MSYLLSGIKKIAVIAAGFVSATMIFLAVLIVMADPFNRRPNDLWERTDYNGDGEISRAEWIAFRAYDFNLSTTSGVLRQFEYADCNSDGRLTWKEYRNYKWGPINPCDPNSSVQPHPLFVEMASDSLHHDRRPFPFIIENEEVPEPGSVRAETIAQYLRSRLEFQPLSFYEEPVISSGQDIELSCYRDNDTPFPLQDSLLASGVYPSVTCSVQNKSTAAATSMILLKAVETINDRDQSNILVKPLYLEPMNLASLTIIFDEGSTPVSVSVAAAKNVRQMDEVH